VKSRAQSILEYVIVLGVVAAAVVAMQTYFKRAVNARLEEVKQENVPKATAQSPVIVGSPTVIVDPPIVDPPIECWEEEVCSHGTCEKVMMCQ